MIPNVLPVVFRGRLGAVAGNNRVSLAPHAEVLEEDHPDRTFVSVMCFHARDVLIGRVHGPLRDDYADLVARLSLMTDPEFARRPGWPTLTSPSSSRCPSIRWEPSVATRSRRISFAA